MDVILTHLQTREKPLPWMRAIVQSSHHGHARTFCGGNGPADTGAVWWVQTQSDQMAWVHILALSFTGCMTLGNLVKLARPPN